MKPNLRDIVESILLDKFSGIVRPFTARDIEAVERYKDGSFAVSALGFALYSNGHNLRGRSSFHPYGLIYEGGENIFSIGYFRKELEPDSEGYLFIIAPRGIDPVTQICSFTNEVLSDERLSCRGVYVRFLTLDQYLSLLNKQFLPVEENPWHPDSPKEDETVNSALLTLDEVIDGDKIKNEKLAYAVRRFDKFLRTNNLIYRLEPYEPTNFSNALSIVAQHFETLRRNGNKIGSTTEDHLNSLSIELNRRPNVVVYMGYLGELPVSIFAGEMIHRERVALYTPFTLRSPEQLLPKLRIETTGESKRAIEDFLPRYAYARFFRKLIGRGIKEVHMGGSEHKDLNRFKREMGCKEIPSYWVVKSKSK